MATIIRRPSAEGKLAFMAQIRIAGHPAEAKTFDDLKEAKAYAKQREKELRALPKAQGPQGGPRTVRMLPSSTECAFGIVRIGAPSRSST